MGDSYWRYGDGRQPPPQAIPSLIGKRPRSDYDAPSSHELPSYFSRDDERGALRGIRDTDTIGASYDRYLRSAQLSAYGGGDSGRPLSGGLADDPRSGSIRGMDPRATGKDRTLGFGGGRPEISLPADASSTLFVEGLPANCTRREVSHIFRPFVGYKEVRLVSKESRHSGGDPLVLCFVDFVSPAHAATAMDALQVLKMSSSGIIELCDHDEIGESNGEYVRKEPNSISGTSRLKRKYKIKKLQLLESVEDRSSNAFSTAQTNSTVLDQGDSPVDESSLSSAGPIGPAPITRQFWKAGDYDGGQGSHTASQNGKNYLRIHPMFLHSNATSHKWVFGAIAELLDNAVDEIQNGATFVAIDKISNPRDGSPGLLIQDDGGGMDPEAIRRCMSFGYSDKKLKIAIGQYGNGFKTSSMRLGADAIVFSRHLKNRKQTQSIGLLSYTFLRQMGHDRLVVPMVDYEFNASARTFEAILSHGKEHFSSNLSTLLQWSPYSTAEELLKQFDNIGHHGTKVIVYNLWLNSDGDMELDFSSHSEDIRIKGDSKLFQAQQFSFPIKDLHIANMYRYSLRAYTSILYLRIPQSFRIILRGRIVEPHNIASDLRYPEFIMYKPQLGGNVEAKVLTTLGFWKDCPHVHFHGFSIYHRNRLVLPFWSVIKHSNGIGRGVVGVLEANFMEPTHNKQDFEKTSLFQKLEARLKEMQVEYWYLHCTLIGYQPMKKVSPSLPSQDKQSSRTHSYQKQSVSVNNNSCGYDSLKVASSTVESFQNSVFTPSYVPAKRARSQPGLNVKKKKQNLVAELNECNGVAQSADVIENQLQNQETVGLLQEQRRLKSLLLQIEQREEELNLKVQRLRSELEDAQHEYAKLLAELNKMDITEEEKNTNAYYEKENHCL